MNLISDLILQVLRRELATPDLYIELRPTWGALNPDCREQIRQGIAKLLRIDEMLVAASPPILRDCGLSISHCPSAGGFCISSTRVHLGFDVEEIARLRPQTVHRVSTPDEFTAAPQASDLWVAKEAAWKSTAPHNPPLLSQIQIHHWSKLDLITTFQASVQGDGEFTLLPGIGGVVQISNIQFAIFVST